MKVTASLLVSAYLLTTASPVFAQSFLLEDDMTPVMHFTEEQNILQPLSDGLLHEEMPLSRQDLVMSIARLAYKNDIRKDCFDRISTEIPARFTHLFSDIPVTHSAAQEICVGMFVGIIQGKENGLFKPQESTNLVEAAKVITKAYGIAPLESLKPQPNIAWHEPFWYALAKRGAIPETVESRDSIITRGEFAEMLFRLEDDRPVQGFHYQSIFVNSMAKKTDVESATMSDILPTVSVIDSIVVSVAATKLSRGLQIQMHTEERRIARLKKTQDSQVSTSTLPQKEAKISDDGQAFLVLKTQE